MFGVSEELYHEFFVELLHIRRFSLDLNSSTYPFLRSYVSRAVIFGLHMVGSDVIGRSLSNLDGPSPIQWLEREGNIDDNMKRQIKFQMTVAQNPLLGFLVRKYRLLDKIAQNWI